METSNKSIGQWWNDLPLFAEGIPASLSVTQVIAKVKKILATCGLGYDKPLANYDPATQSWRMSEGIFPSGEQPSLPTLPPSGMTRNGALFQQPAWEPITGGTASSLLPTPTASEHKYRLQGDSQQSHCLEAMARRGELAMWPTPTAVTRPMEGNVRLYRAKVEAGEMTEAEAEAILGKSVWKAQGKLPAMWPTPKSSDHKAAVIWPIEKTRSRDMALRETIAEREPSAIGGKLNPTWVEWLMGFPTGWTDLEA